MCIAAVFACTMGLRSLWKECQVSLNGTVKEASVIGGQRRCIGRNNRIDVLVEGRKYSLKISLEDCLDEVYKPGQTILVRHHPDYDIILRPGQRPEKVLPYLLGIALTIIVFAIAHYYWEWKERKATEALNRTQPIKRISPRQRRKLSRQKRF